MTIAIIQPLLGWFQHDDQRHPLFAALPARILRRAHRLPARSTLTLPGDETPILKGLSTSAPRSSCCDAGFSWSPRRQFELQGKTRDDNSSTCCAMAAHTYRCGARLSHGYDFPVLIYKRGVKPEMPLAGPTEKFPHHPRTQYVFSTHGPTINACQEISTVSSSPAERHSACQRKAEATT